MLQIKKEKKKGVIMNKCNLLWFLMPKELIKTSD